MGESQEHDIEPKKVDSEVYIAQFLLHKFPQLNNILNKNKRSM